MTVLAKKQTAKGRAKREMIVDFAAEFINTNGAGSVTLIGLAAALGMSRKLLYYYVRDRNELIYLCYERACDMMIQSLDIADREAAPKDRLALFIELALAVDAPTQVAIADLELLSDEQRRAITLKVDEILHRIRAIIDAEIVIHRMQSVDSLIAAHLIIGTINSARATTGQLSITLSENYRVRLIDSIKDLYIYGLSTTQSSELLRQPNVKSIPVSITDPFDRKQLRDVRADKILASASRLFNRRGFESVSIDDIARELNMSIGGFYHYFSSKTELVSACFRRGFRLHRLFLETAKPELSGLERMTTAVHLHTQAQIGAITPLVMQPGWESVDPSDREEILALVDALNNAGTEVCNSGAKDGSMRTIDVLFTGWAIASSMLWLPKWLEPTDDHDARRIADAVTLIQMHGLAVR